MNRADYALDLEERLDAANRGRQALATELAALKARRCDGCSWWSTERGATYGFCEAFNDCATKPDHACNAWTPTNPTDQEPTT